MDQLRWNKPKHFPYSSSWKHETREHFLSHVVPNKMLLNRLEFSIGLFEIRYHLGVFI